MRLIKLQQQKLSDQRAMGQKVAQTCIGVSREPQCQRAAICGATYAPKHIYLHGRVNATEIKWSVICVRLRSFCRDRMSIVYS